jgi:peptide/nickel transport system substrate-binding protein
VPNDKYWARQPNLDAIVFHFIPDPAQQVAALIGSTADLIHLEPQLDLVSTVAAMKDVHSEITFGPRSLAVDFNVKTPGLDDLVVRKAIATAIDRPSLLRLTVGQFTGAQVDNNRMFVDKQPQYQDTSAGLYSRADLAKAKQMLEQDGYALGSDGVYAKGGRRLSFRISATAGDALGKQAESVVQGQLALAGVDVKIDNAHNLAPGTPAGKYDFDIGLFATVHSPFPSDSNVRYSQVGSRNYGQSGNALLDEMLDLGAAELDGDKQAADYNQADTLIWQNMWTLPLFQEPAFLAVRSSFRNVHENVNPEGPFWNAQTWGLMPLTP